LDKRNYRKIMKENRERKPKSEMLIKKIKSMKTKILHLVVTFCFLGLLPVKTVALNYTISFTGTRANYMVYKVIVQNLTQCFMVTKFQQ
jgi:hypothetical protein